jgi:hypothetical protein
MLFNCYHDFRYFRFLTIIKIDKVAIKQEIQRRHVLYSLSIHRLNGSPSYKGNHKYNGLYLLAETVSQQSHLKPLIFKVYAKGKDSPKCKTRGGKNAKMLIKYSGRVNVLRQPGRDAPSISLSPYLPAAAAFSIFSAHNKDCR